MDSLDRGTPQAGTLVDLKGHSPSSQTATCCRVKLETNFKALLEQRAKSSLFNPNEISDEALDIAVGETFEECKGLIVKQWVMMDFAMIRLKMYLKIPLSEEDIITLKNAMSAIKSSPSENSPKISNIVYAKI
ncbi:MAG: hypothetical protein ACOCMY_00135 [Campylobacter hyointestinalis]